MHEEFLFFSRNGSVFFVDFKAFYTREVREEFVRCAILGRSVREVIPLHARVGAQCCLYMLGEKKWRGNLGCRKGKIVQDSEALVYESLLADDTCVIQK